MSQWVNEEAEEEKVAQDNDGYFRVQLLPVIISDEHQLTKIQA